MTAVEERAVWELLPLADVDRLARLYLRLASEPGGEESEFVRMIENILDDRNPARLAALRERVVEMKKLRPTR